MQLQPSSNLKNFLEIPYEQLKTLNLETKSARNKRKPNDYFKKKITQSLQKETRIKAVTLCFTDLEGCFHMLDYDKEFLLNNEDNLTFDGSSVRGFTHQNESDLRLKIDWSSFRFLPSDVFGSGKVLVFSFIYDRQNKPYKSCFRSKLYAMAEKLYSEEKIIAQASPEIEGFLLNNIDAEQNFSENNGFHLVTQGGYYHALPQDPLRQFIDRVAEAQRAMGFENEKDHPEVAPSQFELNFKYSSILDTADQIQLYKLICRQIAKNLGFTACFLPKPVMGINGSGMHTNFSLEKNGVNLFYNKNQKDSLSTKAREIINIILYHAKDLCLIINSSVNSYRRLDPSFEAPNEIKVSAIDRGSMIRIPLGNQKTSRIEIRSVAPDTNPYLWFFVLLSLVKKTTQASLREKQQYANVLQKREKLPGNIYDAIRYFKISKTIKDILEPENHLKYLQLKQEVAYRSPRNLGTKVKYREVVDHHEIRNQMLWGNF